MRGSGRRWRRLRGGGVGSGRLLFRRRRGRRSLLAVGRGGGGCSVGNDGLGGRRFVVAVGDTSVSVVLCLHSIGMAVW